MSPENTLSVRNGGNRFGMHRVVAPSGVLPQQAEKVDSSLPIFDDELLIEVETLNIDSASFHQIKQANNNDIEKMKTFIRELVKERGKHHNPVTGSGGMLIGKIVQIGPRFLEGKKPSEQVSVGDRIATLVSLTLTPLEIRKIKKINLEADQVDIEGHAVLFQSGIYAKLPPDIPEKEALAMLDVCGAPAQTELLCEKGQIVVIVGGAGKSGILCCYAAKKKVGPLGRVIALDYLPEAVTRAAKMPFVDVAEVCDARQAVSVYELVRDITHSVMADIVINVANIPDTEMACILAAKPGGVVYFFSMATSFTKATLGAEGVGADVKLMMGNGYSPGHAEIGLQILRDSPHIKTLFHSKYG